MNKAKHAWFRPRNYLHFDHPIGKSTGALKAVEKIVSNPQAISKHSFYPFIKYTLSSSKVTKDSSGKLIQKPKNRPISYASHMDSQIYGYYSHILSQHYETHVKESGIHSSVLAFRKLGKSNIDFAFEAFEAIKSIGNCDAIAFDISGFFDNLDHDVLKTMWSKVIGNKKLPDDHYAVYRSLTRFSTTNKDDLYKAFGISLHNPITKNQRICSPEEFRNKVRKNNLIKVNDQSKGIPQGSPISALLSNIYMLEFDQNITEIINEVGGKYYRYCDDMLFIVPYEFTGGIEAQVKTELTQLKIELNNDKTEKRRFKENKGNVFSFKPLQYLGFTFNGEKILLRSASLARYSERMKRGVALAKATKYKRNELRIKSGRPRRRLFKNKLYERYSHLGNRNFIRYGIRAADKMNAKSIKRQLKPLWKRLHDEINK